MLYLVRMFCKLLTNQTTFDNYHYEQYNDDILWEATKCEMQKENHNDKNLEKKDKEYSDNEEIDSINSFEIV